MYLVSRSLATSYKKVIPVITKALSEKIAISEFRRKYKLGNLGRDLLS